MSLTFDEEDHEYKVDGLVIPSVTQIISEMGLSNVNLDDPAVIQAGQFGMAVHKTCELHDKGTLDINTVDEALRPYLEAWNDFKSDHKVELLEIEQRLYHSVFFYAGTIDRVGIIGGKRYIIDIKTSVNFPPTLGLQTAAYQGLYNSSNGKARATQRRGVLLKPDGNYAVQVITNTLDWNVFLSALTAYRWKMNNLK